MVPNPIKLPVPNELVVPNTAWTEPAGTFVAVGPKLTPLAVMAEPVVPEPNTFPVLAKLAFLEPKRPLVALVALEIVHAVALESVAVSEDIPAAFGSDCSG